MKQKQENNNSHNSLDLFMSGFIDHKLALFEESIKARLSTQVTHTTVNIPSLNIQATTSEYVRPELTDILNLLIDGHNVFITGESGTGKSYLASQVSQILALPYGYLNCSLGTNENDLYGRHTPVGFQSGLFWNCIKDGGVFLLDEMDAADESVLLSVNTILSSKKGSLVYNKNNGESCLINNNFYLLAAGNTKLNGASLTYNSRNKLDGAFVNRFTCVNVGYDDVIEKSLCDEETHAILNEMRVKLKKNDCSELITTRDFEKFYKLKTRFGKDKAIKLFTNLWSDEAQDAIR